jgi:hypothetical protein
MKKIYQSGFTLFEIASSIVIIFLLATIMWIGQSVMFNLKVSRLTRDFHSIQMAIYDSRDGLRAKLGDVHTASLHFRDSASVSDKSNWNAIVGGKWNSTSGENFSLWQNLRPVGLAQGVANRNPDSYVPLKSSGNETGVSENHSAPIAGIKGDYVICTNSIAGQFAKELDIVMDDGNTTSGSMRVSNSFGSTGIAMDNIVNNSTYLVCLGV